MKVEFSGRFQDKRKKSQDEAYIEYTKKLINPDYETAPDIKFTYDPITLDLDNVDEWIRVDHVHTQLNMKRGNLYIIKIPYLHFCKLYEDLQGVRISVVEVSTELVEQEDKEID